MSIYFKRSICILFLMSAFANFSYALRHSQITNGKNLTPLMSAALHGDTERAICLIKGGADLDARNKNDRTALMKATMGGIWIWFNS